MLYQLFAKEEGWLRLAAQQWLPQGVPLELQRAAVRRLPPGWSVDAESAAATAPAVLRRSADAMAGSAEPTVNSLPRREVRVSSRQAAARRLVVVAGFAIPFLLRKPAPLWEPTLPGEQLPDGEPKAMLRALRVHSQAWREKIRHLYRGRPRRVIHLPGVKSARLAGNQSARAPDRRHHRLGNWSASSFPARPGHANSR